MECKKVITRADVDFCKDAILEFRPNVDPKSVVDQVFKMVSDEGFEIFYIADEQNTRAAAFIGFRRINMLRTGPIFYIDDLFTLPEWRGKGYAGALLDEVARIAPDRGILSIHLDSGYTLHPAHRLYLNKGYFLACNHFAKHLT